MPGREKSALGPAWVLTQPSPGGRKHLPQSRGALSDHGWGGRQTLVGPSKGGDKELFPALVGSELRN